MEMHCKSKQLSAVSENIFVSSSLINLNSVTKVNLYYIKYVLDLEGIKIKLSLCLSNLL